MAEIEAKVSERVVEACTRTGSVRKCVLTSSLLACIWQDDLPSVINEESWSEEQVCTDRKLWYALGKVKAEKAAWRKAQGKGLKLGSVCGGLITGPDFFSRNSTSTLAYLKGGEEMYGKGLLATVDVKRLAKAHLCVWEGLSKGAFGRFICFDNLILSTDSAEKLAKLLGFHTHKICGSDHSSHSLSPSFHLSDHKLLHLFSSSLSRCFHHS